MSIVYPWIAGDGNQMAKWKFAIWNAKHLSYYFKLYYSYPSRWKKVYCCEKILKNWITCNNASWSKIFYFQGFGEIHL